jgi:NADPH-dependent 2,4-dienoyl-CoA reductase/sulfur reductase-like enzyme
VEVAGLAVAAGSQAIHVSAATDAGAALGVTEAHTPHEPGLLLPYAALVKAHVPVPVIAVGRLEPAVAETVLAEGGADFVAMGRKLLADPDLPNKLATGRASAIRPCIYQYRCIGNIFLNEPLACVANPATGHGDEERLPPAARPRRVLVVGAGPGGIETAVLLDERGHRVVLAEAAPELGGTLALAARTDETLAQFLTWQLERLAASGVELLVSTPVTRELAGGLEVDEVVVASGGRWSVPDVPGGHLVLSLSQLAGWLRDDGPEVGETVAILGGGKAGLSLAGLAARRGRAVVVLEPSEVLAPELGPPGRFRLVYDIEQLGVTLVTGAALEGVSPAGVTWQVGSQEGSSPAVTVITATRGADLSLAESLAAGGRPVHVVGDAVGAGGLEGALADARTTALALD